MRYFIDGIKGPFIVDLLLASIMPNLSAGILILEASSDIQVKKYDFENEINSTNLDIFAGAAKICGLGPIGAADGTRVPHREHAVFPPAPLHAAPSARRAAPRGARSTARLQLDLHDPTKRP